MMLLMITILIHECFTIKLSLRIYGGIDAKLEDYPYVVRIEKQTTDKFINNTIIVYHRHICTASALSPVWLITAAHCLKIKYPIIHEGPPNTIIKMIIRYGHVENSPWRKNSFSEVLYTIMHPLYTIEKIGPSVKTSRNDIGLLKASQMNIQCYMKVSAVDYRTIYGHVAVLGGFGLTANPNAKDKIEINSTLYLMRPLQLLKVLVSKCGPHSPLVPGLCLASRCSDITTVCPGDSGGPVIHPSGLIGVISIGQSKCRNEIPRVNRAAIITPVSPYIEWIYSYVNT